MADEKVIYDDREVSKKSFRVFIYAKEGAQKLVESWEDFHAHISSGNWFAKKESVPEKKPQASQNISDKKPLENVGKK